MSALIRDRPDIPTGGIKRIRRLMDMHFPAAHVEGYEHLIESLAQPDADGRHVLAAALHCKARIIVTANLRDFPESALADFGVEALRPEAFILGLLDDHQNQAIAALYRLRLSLENPPYTVADLLTGMKYRDLMASADAFSSFLDVL